MGGLRLGHIGPQCVGAPGAKNFDPRHVLSSQRTLPPSAAILALGGAILAALPAAAADFVGQGRAFFVDLTNDFAKCSF